MDSGDTPIYVWKLEINRKNFEKNKENDRLFGISKVFRFSNKACENSVCIEVMRERERLMKYITKREEKIQTEKVKWNRR